MKELIFVPLVGVLEQNNPSVRLSIVVFKRCVTKLNLQELLKLCILTKSSFWGIITAKFDIWVDLADNSREQGGKPETKNGEESRAKPPYHLPSQHKIWNFIRYCDLPCERTHHGKGRQTTIKNLAYISFLYGTPLTCTYACISEKLINILIMKLILDNKLNYDNLV